MLPAGPSHLSHPFPDLIAICYPAATRFRQRGQRKPAEDGTNLWPLDHTFRTRGDALFIDEAQDVGESTLALLSRLVVPKDAAEPSARSVYIFYDNAQNLYRRGTPVWSNLGLAMRGRSTVMKESFRSTQPITEYALNVLYRLRPPERDPDHRELFERDLIERSDRNRRPWWRVRFNQVQGPAPNFRRYATRQQGCARSRRALNPGFARTA